MTTKFHDLTDLKKGSYNWKVKVRVIRFWRGVTKSGEEFKGFNLLLLDDKGNRIHAFVPGNVAEDIQHQISLGKIHSFINFQVKDYKPNDKYRCIHYDTMLIFTQHTKIKLLMEMDAMIEKNAFDFYDLAQMKALANDNVYLTDVIGVIKLDEPLRKFTNKYGVPQTQYKFEISDGRTTVKVTLWDSLAELFDHSLTKEMEQPLIIIIASAKVGLWQEDVDISNVPATMFYINYPHDSVFELRKLLRQPLFSQLNFSTQQNTHTKLYSVSEIKKFGKEYMGTEVICQVRIRFVEPNQNWYFFVCTSCNKDIENQDGNFKCIKCNRNVPYPHKRFEIATVCSDDTGGIDVMLSDRQVRTIIGMTVFEVELEANGNNNFPSVLKKVENLDCTIKILIKEGNLDKILKVYWATDLFIGFKQDDEEAGEDYLEEQTERSLTTGQMNEGSTSSYHLDAFSEIKSQY